MRRLFALGVLAGCGRIGFDDLAQDAALSSDAPICTAPFSPPVALAGPVQTPADDWYPTPTSDELELYFYDFGGAANDAEIVHATRATRTDLFSAAVAIPELASPANETSSTITDDELDLVLTRVVGNEHLFETRRTSTAQPWGTPVQITSIVVGTSELAPWLSPDGLRLTFISQGGPTNGDIYETTRADRSSPWSPPVELAPLDSAQDEDNPTESADGLEIFFSSNRPGGPGAYDVYHARRPALDQPFDAPVLVLELSTTQDDIGARLSRDGTHLYMNFGSVRAGGQNSDLFMATRACP